MATLVLSFESPLSRQGFVEITGTEATMSLPDPNRFDGELRLRSADAADWEVVPATGPADGRGLGVLDLARVLRHGGSLRAPGELGLHVLDTMEAIDRSAAAHSFEPVRLLLRPARRPGLRLGPEGADSRIGRRHASEGGKRVEQTADRPVLGVGMVGYAFMGAAHSQAWRTAPHVFDLPLRPAMAALCGRDATAVRAAADRLGWAATQTDWRTLIERDDVDLVDVCTPGDSHAEVAIAALAAGKHVLCEKPLANTEAEAEAMAARRSAPPPAASAR